MSSNGKSTGSKMYSKSYYLFYYRPMQKYVF